MKVSNKLFDEIILNLVSEDVLDVARLIKDKKNLSEFKIAEILGKEVNEVRNLLYKLYQINLVTFSKKKDIKKGWYIYYWTFKPKQLKYALNNLNKIKLAKKKDLLEKEQNNSYFFCRNRCIRLDFEQALSYDYKCPECGALMEHYDNKPIINELESEIKELQDIIF